MAVPRSTIVDGSVSSLYHCLSRCVRRAFLLGSEGDDHRRDWIVDRLHTLCDAFAIDVATLAVMTNHMHLILRTLPELVAEWSDREIAYRWLLVRPQRRRRRKLGIPLDAPPQAEEIDEICDQPGRIAALRARLATLSWFMKELKEPLARMANAEDGVDGRFWQDRFRSHRLLDDAALLCCATYVDLNPVKAGMAEDPLQATHTSASLWIRRLLVALAERGESGSPESGVLGTDIDELLSACDDVLLLPAILARREPHLREDDAANDRPEVGVSCPTAQHSPLINAATPNRVRSTHAPSPHAPAVPLLQMTLGSYLRRLRAIASSMVEAVRTRTAARQRAKRPATHESDDRPIDLQSILDGAATDASTYARAYSRLQFWGNAVGSTSRLVDEAIRRGVIRVVLALRDGSGDIAPARTLAS